MLVRALTASAIASLIPLAGFAASSNNADAQRPTWADQVAPLLYERCVSCHRPGQVAPMSLLTYQEARPWAKAIRAAVATRTMPPWFANPEHGTFVEDPRFTEAEIETITRWVAAGAPAGDLSQAPEPPTFTSVWRIGEPDVVLTMEPFEVTDEMEDHYQWVKVANPLTEDRWIKSIEIRPSFMEGAHHNLTYIVPGSFTEADIAGAGRMEMDYVAGWAPGVAPMTYHDGYGKLLPAGSSIFFQMHYHKTPGPGTGGIDQTSVAFALYDDEPENELTTLWVVDPAISIPPGEAAYPSASSFTFPHEAVLFNFTPHMHLRGKAMRFTATYPDGREEILLDVPEYDFNWQLTYTPPEPLVLPAGTKVAVDAVFDNSSENEANPDPSITVRWGEKTTDEMMIGFMDYSYADKANQEQMETHAVPEHIREQMTRLRELQRQQPETKEPQGASGDR
ncbi:MAG TPA: hypothetical protein VMV46_14960 [Thermoanaerobaculia bacterium]|nr:hypothetical protein [Thermoanaerobaculia bacterium]